MTRVRIPARALSSREFSASVRFRNSGRAFETPNLGFKSPRLGSRWVGEPMTATPHPVMLKFELPPGLHTCTLRSVDPRNRPAWKHTKDFPLPENIAYKFDYEPSRAHLLLNQPLESAPTGWSIQEQSPWESSNPRAKSRIAQALIDGHLKTRTSRVTQYDWELLSPFEIESETGTKAILKVCANFRHVSVQENEYIVVDIRRKVESASSIQEEIENGTFEWNEGTDVRVKARSAADAQQMSSGKLHSILPVEVNLHHDAWAGGIPLLEYWNQLEKVYDDESAERVRVVEVKLGKRRDALRYPADQVYRVMTMENWSKEVRVKVSEFLNLRPAEFFEYATKAMRWFRGWSVNGSNIKVEYAWNNPLPVFKSDSRKILKLPDGRPFLNHNYRWKQHLSDFEELHGRPPPSIAAYFLVPKGFENLNGQLQTHCKSIFSQIPDWYDRVIPHPIESIDASTRVQAEADIGRFIESVEPEGRQPVVFSAIPPRRSQEDLNLYPILKRKLTLSDIVHQNFQAVSQNVLKARGDDFVGQVNVLGMLLKCGFLPVPYVCEHGDVDIVCGIDIGRQGPNRSIAAVAVSITRDGKLWGTTPEGTPQTGETIRPDALRNIIGGIVERFQSSATKSYGRIVILRDGKTPDYELQDAIEIITEYRGIGIDISWISVLKSGNPRLLSFSNSDLVDEIPEKGHWMPISSTEAWFWSTGRPELKEGRPGIPQGTLMRIEANFAEKPLKLSEFATLLIAHAHASQSQPWNSTRLPFVLDLADKMAKSMGEGSIPLSINKDWFPAA